VRVVGVGTDVGGRAAACHRASRGYDVAMLGRFVDSAGTVPAVGIPMGFQSGRLAAARVDEVAA